MFHHAVTVHFVQERARRNTGGQGAFALVAERSVPNIVSQADGLGQIRVQLPVSGLVEPAADGRGNGGHVQHVFYARADMVVVRREKHLGFMF